MKKKKNILIKENNTIIGRDDRSSFTEKKSGRLYNGNFKNNNGISNHDKPVCNNSPLNCLVRFQKLSQLASWIVFSKKVIYDRNKYIRSKSDMGLKT